MLFAGQSGRIRNRGTDMHGLERRIGPDYLVVRGPFGKRIQNHRHRHTRPFGAKLAACDITSRDQVFPPIDHGLLLLAYCARLPKSLVVLNAVAARNRVSKL